MKCNASASATKKNNNQPRRLIWEKEGVMNERFVAVISTVTWCFWSRMVALLGRDVLDFSVTRA